MDLNSHRKRGWTLVKRQGRKKERKTLIHLQLDKGKEAHRPAGRNIFFSEQGGRGRRVHCLFDDAREEIEGGWQPFPWTQRGACPRPVRSLKNSLTILRKKEDDARPSASGRFGKSD